MKVIFLHGYSGSPKNFFGLEKKVENQAKVKVLNYRLPGHYGNYDELAKLTYQEFYDDVKKLINEDCIIVGYSLGSLLALDLASKHKKIKAVVAIATPYLLKFPFNFRVPKTSFTLHKRSSTYEREMSQHEYYMDRVPLYGNTVISDGKRKLVENLNAIKQPVLLVEQTNDMVTLKGNGKALASKLHTSLLSIVKKKDGHNPLFPKTPKRVENQIISFIKSHTNSRS